MSYGVNTMAKLPDDVIEKYRDEFEKLVRNILDERFLERDEKGNYKSPTINKSWLFSIGLAGYGKDIKHD